MTDLPDHPEPIAALSAQAGTRAWRGRARRRPYPRGRTRSRRLPSSKNPHSKKPIPLLQEPSKEASRAFTEGLFRKAANPLAAEESIFGKPVPGSAESVWTRDKVLGGGAPAAPSHPRRIHAAPQITSPNSYREGGLIEKAARLKMFEPGKALCNKSMVKTADGEVISEYFYSPLHPKDGRHYIFNSLYAVWSLLIPQGQG